jgi:4-amino-4-deoxy-L-arabinose transferase-like glycosyltransferase
VARNANRVLLAILVVVALAIGVDNMARTLANPDEGRYSEIAREMAHSGDWVTPRLDGVKYFEKPPLQYWATAASFNLFGENEITARLYVFLCGLATLGVVGFAGSRLWGREAGAASVLALVASPYYMAMGGIVTLDMGLTLWTTATFCAWLLSERPGIAPREHRRWSVAAWAFIALAVLSKGLVGLLFPTAALGLTCLMRRDFSPLARMQWGRGLAVFAAIAAPWFVLVSLANPEFARFFFVHEHFERFLTTAHRRVEPWYYFVPILFAGFLPWMFALPAAIVKGWRDEADAPGLRPMRFTLVFAGFILAFFSASGSKLPAYILPIFPPLALALGSYLATAPTRRLALMAAPTVLVAIALGVAAWRAPSSAGDEWNRSLYQAALPWTLAAALLLGVGGAAAAALLWRGRRWLALVCAAASVVFTIDCVEEAYDNFSPRVSGLAVALKMKPLLTPATRLYSVRHYDQTVPFYIGRTLRLVDYFDEFETGLNAEPGMNFPMLGQFIADWMRPGDALAIMQPGTFETLQYIGLPMQVIHEDPRRVLVRKP